MYDLKNNLASIIAEAENGTDVLINRHNKPVALITRPAVEYLYRGARFGSADLKPAVRANTAGRYLEFLARDRRPGRE